jgi:hypothetical protein
MKNPIPSFETEIDVRHGRGWQILLLLPPLLVFALFAVWAGIEYRASQAIDSTIQARKAAGKPTTLTEMTEATFKRSNVEGTNALRKLIRHGHNVRSILPNSDMMVMEQFLYSPETVDALAFGRALSNVEDYFSTLQPLFSRVDELEKMPRPIWFPEAIERGGYESVSTRQVATLIECDILIAIRQQDRSRIMVGLERLITLESMSPGWEFSRSFAYAYSRARSRLSLLIHCLSNIDWTENELTRLESFARATPEWTPLWREDSECWIVANLGTDFANLWSDAYDGRHFSARLFGPTLAWKADRQQFLNQMAGMSFADPVRAAEELGSYPEVDTDPFESHITRYTPDQLFAIESLRQLVECAIAIRRYKTLQKRWPTSLGELAGAGYISAHPTLPNQQVIGFSAATDGPEIWLPLEALKFRSRFSSLSDTTERFFLTPIRDQQGSADSETLGETLPN